MQVRANFMGPPSFNGMTLSTASLEKRCALSSVTCYMFSVGYIPTTEYPPAEKLII